MIGGYNMGIVGFEVPKEVAEETYTAIEAVKGSGNIRKGTNETTKAIERGVAKLVVIAEDIEPKERAMHIPMICKEKKIPYIAVPSKQELGAAAGMEIATASVAIVDAGRGKAQIDAIIRKAQDLAK